MIKIIRIPLTDRNIQSMLYLPGGVTTPNLISTNMVSRELDVSPLQRGLMNIVSEKWRECHHYPISQGISLEPLSNEEDHYQLKLHAISDTDQLLVCLHTFYDGKVIDREMLSVYDGSNKVLEDYMHKLQVKYISEPIEVVRSGQEHLIPFTHGLTDLEDRLKVAKRKLHTSLINDLNSSNIERGTEYDLDENMDIVLKVSGDSFNIALSGELAISDNTCAVVLNTTYQEVTRVHLGPTLLKEYLDYVTALTTLASYHQRVRCNL